MTEPDEPALPDNPSSDSSALQADIRQVTADLAHIKATIDEDWAERVSARLKSDSTSFAAPVAAKMVADLLLGSTKFSLSLGAPFGGSTEKKKTLEEQKTLLVKELSAAGIEPMVFDAMLSNEIDRRLKIRFGVAFLSLTVLFTTASYAIIIMNAVYKWAISDVAITSLIIETPIQFVGLLYVIARNLFPEGRGHSGKQNLRRPKKAT
jgi:hypothetical protein